MLDKQAFDKAVHFHRIGGTPDGFYAFRDQRVYMITGLPPIAYQGLLAHESVHAWQGQFCRGQDDGLKEGLATLIQYHFLMDAGDKYRAKSLLSLPSYGPPLTALLKKEKEIGLTAVIEKARVCKTLSQVMAP